MEHEVEQTKISCDNIIKQHEQQEQERFTRSRSNSSAAMVKELEEKVGILFRALEILLHALLDGVCVKFFIFSFPLP